jgi:dihydrofolate reductase
VKHLKAIAAMSENRVIGSQGRIPWRLPDDFKWFKKRTMGQVLVMGRKTFESIGRPLPGRETIVLTRKLEIVPGARLAGNLDELDPAREEREMFICGGAEIYAQALPRCSDLYLTLVKRVVEGDAFFPAFEDVFEPVEVIDDQPDFRIVHYRNRQLLQEG